MTPADVDQGGANWAAYLDAPRHLQQKARQAWRAMHARCSGRAGGWSRYEGVSVDPAWDDFQTFARDLGPPPSERHSLGRWRDDPRGYGPGLTEDGHPRVSWQTRQEQHDHRRVTRWLALEQAVGHHPAGKVDTIRGWAATFDVSFQALRSRVTKGQPLAGAIEALLASREAGRAQRYAPSREAYLATQRRCLERIQHGQTAPGSRSEPGAGRTGSDP